MPLQWVLPEITHDCCFRSSFQSQSVGNLAMNSQNVSKVLNETASHTEDKVDNELSDLLNHVKSRLALIKRKIGNVSRDLFDVGSNFPEFEEMASLGKF